MDGHFDDAPAGTTITGRMFYTALCFPPPKPSASALRLAGALGCEDSGTASDPLDGNHAGVDLSVSTPMLGKPSCQVGLVDADGQAHDGSF